MKLEKTSGLLRALADRLFAFVEELSGERPQFIASDGWYHAWTNGNVFVYLYLVGKTPRRIHNTPSCLRPSGTTVSRLGG